MRYLLFALFFLALPLCADLPLLGESVGTVRTLKINYHEQDTILYLDDTSLWEIKSNNEKPERTWYEWWYGLEPKEWGLDASYFFEINTWLPSTQVRIYQATCEFYPGFKHIIENVHTGEKAFAKYLPLDSMPIPKMEIAAKYLNFPVNGEIKILRNLTFMSGVILLEDGALWQLQDVSYHHKTFYEWWYGIAVEQPDLPFVFDKVIWLVGHDVQVYEYLSDSSIDCFYSFNSSEDNVSRTYLIENRSTGQLAYAVPIAFDQLLDMYEEYSKKEYWRGYEDGYSDGYSNGSN